VLLLGTPISSIRLSVRCHGCADDRWTDGYQDHQSVGAPLCWVKHLHAPPTLVRSVVSVFRPSISPQIGAQHYTIFRYNAALGFFPTGFFLPLELGRRACVATVSISPSVFQLAAIIPWEFIPLHIPWEPSMRPSSRGSLCGSIMTTWIHHHSAAITYHLPPTTYYHRYITTWECLGYSICIDHNMYFPTLLPFTLPVYLATDHSS